MPASPMKLDWPTLLLLALQWLLFAGNFVLWWVAPLPWPVHVAAGALAVHLAFTIWHEAAHGNVSNRRWVNHAVGVAGMLPYGTPYFLQRSVHLDHHKYLNDPERDPNQIYADGPFWQLPLRYVRAIGYARRKLRDDPRTPAQRASDGLFLVLVIAAFSLALWRGFLPDLLLLWVLPVLIAKLVMDWYVNYLPHAGLPQDRFLGTRIVDVAWLTPLVLEHNYHAIHHLWPGIPWHGYTGEFARRRDYLRQHGVPVEQRVFGERFVARAPASRLSAPRSHDPR